MTVQHPDPPSYSATELHLYRATPLICATLELPFIFLLLIFLLVILVLIHPPTPLSSYTPTEPPPITQQTKRGAPNERPAAKHLVIILLNP